MINQDMFVIGLEDGTSQALYAQTGAVAWEQCPATTLGPSVGAYSQGQILIAYPDGYLRARNVADGALTWEQKPAPNATLPIESYLAWASPTAAVAMFGRHMVAVNPKDGTSLWSYWSNAEETSVLAMNDEHLFVAETYRVRVQSPSAVAEVAGLDERRRAVPSPMILTRAFDVAGGTELWSTAMIATKHPPQGVGVALVEDAGIAYLCGSTLYALGAQSGGILWTVEQLMLRQVARSVIAQMVKWHDVVAWIVDSVVTAVDSVTHEVLWQEDVRTMPTPPSMTFERFDRIITGDDQLYLGRSRFNPDSFWIEVRDPLTGAVRSTFPDDSVILDPNVAWRLQHISHAFAVPTGTSVYAFDPLGNRLWTKDFGLEPVLLLAVPTQHLTSSV
jgi:hypothetical protein